MVALCLRVQMLDEVKRMLLMTEKVHSCTAPNCGRTFATPGNLRDHENEHRQVHTSRIWRLFADTRSDAPFLYRRMISLSAQLIGLRAQFVSDVKFCQTFRVKRRLRNKQVRTAI